MNESNSRNEEYRKMLDLGVISQEEYNVLISGKNEMPTKTKNKKPLVWGLILASLALISVGVYFYTKPNIEVQAIELSKKYVRHQLQNNSAYSSKLYDLQEKINAGTYVFATSVDSELNVLSGQYLRNDLEANILRSSLALTRELEKAELNWPKTSSDGKEFWFTYETANNNNAELKISNEKLAKLLADIALLKEECQIGSAEDLEAMKSEAFARMRTILTNWGTVNFDPYLFFASEVERFFYHRNMSPTELKTLIDSRDELYNATYIPEPGSFELTEKTREKETWEFRLSFEYYNPLTDLYVVSKKTYSVSFNQAGKMSSLFEVKETNRKSMTPEEYNMTMGPGCSL